MSCLIGYEEEDSIVSKPIGLTAAIAFVVDGGVGEVLKEIHPPRKGFSKGSAYTKIQRA